MTLPHYVMAIRSLASNQGSNSATLSAVDVHDFMLERAKEHDICMVILQWLHFVEIGNIIRDLERENNPSLYRVGAKIAMLLYVKTHAKKYVRMGVSYWIWWQCCSDPDKTLYDNFFFTKLTANGSTIFVDRFVEWFNKDVREYLGKFAKPNQELLVTKTTLLVKDRKRWKASNRSSEFDGTATSDGHDENFLEKTLALSPIFCHQLILLQRWNIWGDGPPLVGKKDDVNHFQTANSSSRSENVGKGVPMTATPVKASDVQQMRDAEIIRQTSTDEDQLFNNCGVTFMKDRIAILRSRYAYLQPKKKVKEQYARCLAAHHKAIIRRNKRFLQQTKESIPEWSTPAFGFADQAKKSAELKHPFYSLPEAAKNNFSNKQLVICGQEGGSENSQQAAMTPPRPTTTAIGSETPCLLQSMLDMQL